MSDRMSELAAALDKAAADLAAAEAAHADAVKNAPPRALEIVIVDLLEKIVQRFGNHHELAGLLAELKAGTAPKES